MHALRWTTRTAALAIAAATVAAPLLALAQAANPNDGVEAHVRSLFAQAPVMIAVAKCESGFRQFTATGEVLRGGAGKGYLGVFQIGETLHTATAAKLGFDIRTVDGNLGYALYMYNRQGAVPWRECVPDGMSMAAPATPIVPPPTNSAGQGTPVSPAPVVAPATAPAPAATSGVLTPVPLTAPLPEPAAGAAPSAGAVGAPRFAPLTVNMQTGMVHDQVRQVQQMLNAAGYKVASEGPGSAGNETTRYGALTRAAVQRFQCAKGIACEGNEWGSGYGRVGPRTRAALNAHFGN